MALAVSAPQHSNVRTSDRSLQKLLLSAWPWGRSRAALLQKYKTVKRCVMWRRQIMSKAFAPAHLHRSRDPTATSQLREGLQMATMPCCAALSDSRIPQNTVAWQPLCNVPDRGLVRPSQLCQLPGSRLVSAVLHHSPGSSEGCLASMPAWVRVCALSRARRPACESRMVNGRQNLGEESVLLTQPMLAA